MYNNQEYISYIENHETLTKYQKKEFINYKNNEYKIYQNKTSNVQIASLINYLHDVGDILKIGNLIITFARHIGSKNAYDLVKVVTTNKLQYDDEIIEYIYKEYYYNESHKQHIDNFKKSFLLDKVSDWDYMLDYITFKIMKLKNVDSNFKYLDIGCGNGKKTMTIGKFLNVNVKNIYGTDVQTWGPYKKYRSFDFNFRLIENNKLSFSNGVFDLVSVILTLHHIESLHEMIDEINRVMTKNGILMIIEHNTLSDDERLLIDVQHLLYSIFTDKNKKYLTNPDFMNCYNYLEWEFIFKQHGFTNIMNEMLYPQLENRLKYDNAYFGLFIKN